MVTVTRTTAMPVANISTDFDDGVPSWSSEFAIGQWLVENGNHSDFIGSYGPSSDYTSLCNVNENIISNCI